ncbi:MAG TPA: hypothetical protein VLB32_01990 [Candidatus Acidoferrales bacterium]|nr:hypothetical protein [Candidatus Acidoferrales bacterium]
MTASAFVLPAAAGLVANVRGQEWGFTVRRADLRPAEIFSSYHGKEVDAEDVARFLPGWRTLKWTEVPLSLLSRHELSAVDREYQISLSSNSARTIGRDELIALFLRFMERKQ